MLRLINASEKQRTAIVQTVSSAFRQMLILCIENILNQFLKVISLTDTATQDHNTLSETICSSYWSPQFEQCHSENKTHFYYKVMLLPHSATLLMCWHQYGHYHVKTCVLHSLVAGLRSHTTIPIVLGSAQNTNWNMLEGIIFIRRKRKCPM